MTDLIEHRDSITKMLEAAHRLIPKNVVESDYGYSREVFEEYLNVNELQLAFDELTGVIEDNPSPSVSFWLHLIEAARALGLPTEVDRCEMILKQFHG